MRVMRALIVAASLAQVIKTININITVLYLSQIVPNIFRARNEHDDFYCVCVCVCTLNGELV